MALIRWEPARELHSLQNEVNRLSVQNRESFGPVGSGENAKVLSIQKAGDGLANRDVVINEKDGRIHNSPLFKASFLG